MTPGVWVEIWMPWFFMVGLQQRNIFSDESSAVCERDWPFVHVESAVGKVLGELLINACFMPSQDNWSEVREICCP